MDDLLKCPHCDGFNRPLVGIKEAPEEGRWQCIRCLGFSDQSEWLKYSETPETLNKDDAIKILEAFMSTNDASMSAPIIVSACSYLESLKYQGEV